MSQLSGQDASFLYLENESIKTHVTLVTLYNQSELAQPLRYRDILSYFEERIAGLPVFKRKLFRVPLEIDTPYFADDPHFHIEAHVRHIGLPKPGDWRQFCILAAQIQAMPIDLNKPLWDMHVVEGLDHIEGIPAGSFAILTRLHHAIADGATARGILMALHHPKDQPPSVLPTPQPDVPPTMTEMLVRGAVNNLRQISAMPGRLAKVAPVVGPTLGRVASSAVEKWFASDAGRAELEVANQSHVPDSLFNRGMEYRRVFQLQRFPLESFKRIRALSPGATLNDVVLTLIGGGLRRYLAASGEKHDIDLMALCPVNLRDDKFGTDSVQGNNISLMQINLNTRTATPAKRLAKVVDTTVTAKLAQMASSAKDIIALSRNAPNLLVALGTRLAISAAFRQGSAVRMSNCLITNVPGPQEPLYFMGARLELFTGVAPVTPGTGISFPVSSYCGQLCISFTACPGWVTDPQLLAQCLDDSHAELLAAADKALADGTTGVKKLPVKKAVAKKAVAQATADKKVVVLAAAKPRASRPSASRKPAV